MAVKKISPKSPDAKAKAAKDPKKADERKTASSRQVKHKTMSNRAH